MLPLLITMFYPVILSPPKTVHFINHVHSHFSTDNGDYASLRMSADELLSEAVGFLKERHATGLLAITDHNDMKSFAEMKPRLATERRVTSVPSTEWGLGTHVGLVGLDPDWPLLHRFEDYSSATQIQAAKGTALRIVNHPDYPSREWPSRDWADAEAVEVWNAPFDQRPISFLGHSVGRSHNDLAVEQWVSTLKRGRRYTAVGGSDMHLYVPCLLDRYMFFPENIVLSPTNNPADVLSAVRDGHVTLVMIPEAPKVFLRASWSQGSRTYQMGDTARGKGSLTVSLLEDYSETQVPMRQSCYYSFLTLNNLASLSPLDRWEIRLYRGSQGDKPFVNIPIKPETDVNLVAQSVELEVTDNQPDFVRAELWISNETTHVDELVGLTNPIYLNF